MKPHVGFIGGVHLRLNEVDNVIGSFSSLLQASERKIHTIYPHSCDV